jgi:NTP pyrophosphatase (non-canonical NTP hydrolase)
MEQFKAIRYKPSNLTSSLRDKLISGEAAFPLALGYWQVEQEKKRKEKREMNKDFFQKSIATWGKTNFGDIAYSKEERALRFLEEALELCQVCGVNKEVINHVAKVVYAKPVGGMEMELADAQLNLYALANVHGISLEEVTQSRFLGCLSKDSNYWQARQEKKYESGLSTRI